MQPSSSFFLQIIVNIVQAGRPIASSIAVVVNWSANFAVGLLFSPLQVSKQSAVQNVQKFVFMKSVLKLICSKIFLNVYWTLLNTYGCFTGKLRQTFCTGRSRNHCVLFRKVNISYIFIVLLREAAKKVIF